MLPGEVSESAFHAVAHDGVPYGLAHHEPDPSGSVVGVRAAVGQVDDEGAATGAPARTNRLVERRSVGEAVSRGQHAAGLVWAGVGRQTARLLRPLRRREDRIDRPARVRMRRRKPCTL